MFCSMCYTKKEIKEHITIKKKTIKKKTSLNIYNLNDECSICLCNMDNDEFIKILKCNHVFHNKCIEQWFIKSTICPICSI